MSTFTKRNKNRRGRIERLEGRQMMAADLGGAEMLSDVPDDPQAMIFVRLANVTGDVSLQTESYDNGKWFIADSFSFGVEREMKESGEKGGTEDINIGLGELQECAVSKSMDLAAVDAAMEDTAPMCYLKYKLGRTFIKSWSTSGDADDHPTEEVAFYYNKIAAVYSSTSDGTDGASTDLAQFAINGNSPGTAEIDFVEVAGSGDADDLPTEEMAFYYNKIAAQYAQTTDGREL